MGHGAVVKGRERVHGYDVSEDEEVVLLRDTTLDKHPSHSYDMESGGT